MNIRVFLTLA